MEEQMKKLSALMLLLSGLVAVSFAGEHPLNPDRFPSIGLSLSGQGVSGDQTFPSAPGVGALNREDSLGMFVIDTRLPLSNSFTLELALGSVSYLEESDESAFFNSSKFDASGGYFRIVARWYFNKGAKPAL